MAISIEKKRKAKSDEKTEQKKALFKSGRDALNRKEERVLRQAKPESNNRCAIPREKLHCTPYNSTSILLLRTPPRKPYEKLQTLRKNQQRRRQHLREVGELEKITHRRPNEISQKRVPKLVPRGEEASSKTLGSRESSKNPAARIAEFDTQN